MKRALIVAAAIAGLLVSWLVLGRQLVLLVDGFATDGAAVATTGPFVHSPGWLNVENTPLELTMPDGQAGEVRFDTDASGRVSLHAAGKVFVLGPRGDASEVTGPYDVPFAPDPGDVVTFRVARSVMPWPTPFDLNFMTGKSPSWRRNVYYGLSWRKADGTSLDMTWRYEQWFYDDWGSASMTRQGATGLLAVRIDDR